MGQGWTMLCLVQASLRLDWRTPVHYALVAFLFSKNWSSWRGQCRELLCLPCHNCGGQLAFWFWPILLYHKAPCPFPQFLWEVDTVLYTRHGPCCTPAVLSERAIVPVVAVSSTLPIKRMSHGWKMAVWYGLWDGFWYSIWCSAYGNVSFSQFLTWPADSVVWRKPLEFRSDFIEELLGTQGQRRDVSVEMEVKNQFTSVKQSQQGYLGRTWFRVSEGLGWKWSPKDWTRGS